MAQTAELRFSSTVSGGGLELGDELGLGLGYTSRVKRPCLRKTVR